MRALPLLALCYLALALLFQIETFLIPPRQDSSAWLFMGARQSLGQMPGRDLWDNKLPLIYLVGRAAHATGRPQAFLWIVEAALTAAGALAVFLLTVGVGGRRAAAVAGGMACVVAGTPALHAGGYMTEIYAMPLAAIGTALSCSATRGRCPIARATAAGLFWALAVSFRLPLVIAAALVTTTTCLMAGWGNRCKGVRATATAARAVATGHATTTRAFHVCERPNEPRASVRAALPKRNVTNMDGARPNGKRSCPTAHALLLLTAHLGGALLAVALVFAHPVAAGYLSDCLAAAIAWPLQLHGTHLPGPTTLSTVDRLTEFGQDLLKLGWLHVAAIAGLVVSIRRPKTSPTANDRLMTDTRASPTADAVRVVAPAAGTDPRRLAIILGVWYAASVASAALGWASYAHYQYVTIAPMCAGLALWGSCNLNRHGRRLAGAFVVVTVVVVIAQLGRGVHRRWPDRMDAHRSSVVEFVESHTSADETVLVWAWSGTGDLLYRINRPPGTRHFLAHSYLNMDMRLFRQAVDELLARPPGWIVEDTRISNAALTAQQAGQAIDGHGAATSNELHGSPRATLSDAPPITQPVTLPDTPVDLARLRDFVRRSYAVRARFRRFAILQYDPIGAGALSER